MTRAPLPLEELFERAAPDLIRALPHETFIAFRLDGKDWALHRTGNGDVQVSRRHLPTWDCHVTCSVDDFRDLVDGSLDARRGFMEGRLRVEGDVGLVLDMLRAIRRGQSA